MVSRAGSKPIIDSGAGVEVHSSSSENGIRVERDFPESVRINPVIMSVGPRRSSSLILLVADQGQPRSRSSSISGRSAMYQGASSAPPRPAMRSQEEAPCSETQAFAVLHEVREDRQRCDATKVPSVILYGEVRSSSRTPSPPAPQGRQDQQRCPVGRVGSIVFLQEVSPRTPSPPPTTIAVLCIDQDDDQEQQQQKPPPEPTYVRVVEQRSWVETMPPQEQESQAYMCPKCAQELRRQEEQPSSELQSQQIIFVSKLSR